MVQKHTPLLTAIDSLSDNRIQSVVALSDALKINATLTTLNLDGNGLGGGGAAALSEALKINVTLTSLSYVVLNARARAACSADPCLPCWPCCSLRKTRIGDAGAAALSEALKNNRALSALLLCQNGIGVAGVATLSEALKNNTRLTSLSLAHNKFGDAGVAALSLGNLTSLTLQGIAIGEAGARALSGALERNTTLTSLK